MIHTRLPPKLRYTLPRNTDTVRVRLDYFFQNHNDISRSSSWAKIHTFPHEQNLHLLARFAFTQPYIRAKEPIYTESELPLCTNSGSSRQVSICARERVHHWVVLRNCNQLTTISQISTEPAKDYLPTHAHKWHLLSKQNSFPNKPRAGKWY